MQDDQWPYPASRDGQRERGDGPPAGPPPAQRPGPGRPPNAAPPNATGRASGQINNPGGSQPPMPAAGNQRPPQQRPGASGPLPRPQAPGRDDGWGTSTTTNYQQRRPSGPMTGPGSQTRGGTNTYGAPPGGPTGRKPSGPTAPGGQRQPGRGGSWEDEEQRWLGPENVRPSRGVSAPLETPGMGRQGGRGQAAQWNGGARQRGWADQDEEEGGWQPSGRTLAPGQRRASGGLGTGRPGQGRGDGSGGRGNWVMDPPEPKASPSSLRTKLLLALLVLVVALGATIAAVPSIRNRVLRHIPGFGSSSATSQPTGTTGDLSLLVNVPTAKVTLDGQPVTLQPGQNGGFATVTDNGLTLGNHALAIHADNYADITATAAIKAGPNAWVAWLAPSADALNAALKQFGPTVQPDPGQAGDFYGIPSQKAAGTLNVSISYNIAGFDPKNFTSQMAPGSDTTKSPFQAATVTLAPVFTFKDGKGTTLSTYSLTALPAAQFALQALPGVDAKGAAQVTIAGLSSFKTSGGQGVTTDFSGPAKTDWALYYAIAAVLPASPANALTFKCIGAVDNTKFNPEDGLQIFETANNAHYFYRWGVLWATNGAALALTPKAPHALPGSNEFNGANTANANASCGS